MKEPESTETPEQEVARLRAYLSALEGHCEELCRRIELVEGAHFAPLRAAATRFSAYHEDADRDLVVKLACAMIQDENRQVGGRRLFSLGPEWEKGGEFRSFQEWVNKADSWTRPYRGKTFMHDAKGRICFQGSDFQRARDEDAFPVMYWFRVKD
jgi:hypothetical protein